MCDRKFKVGVIDEFAPCNCNKKKMSSNSKRVVERSGNIANPMPYVHVFNITQNKGTTTRNDGTYDLTANPADEIQFSHIGFKTVKMLFRDIPQVLEMTEQIETLSEVTVVAPSTNTGSTTNVEIKPSNNAKLKRAGGWALGTVLFLGVLLLVTKDNKKKK
ncbi:hypothetical protein [Capnocytophaga canis]|uniref:hypothetical protein n=1 Tax=Capnocytophaga canis TaxID=1848903 RepID=UPI001562256B|nr:hypothetical protein [Capnocytophaga canis]